MSLYFSIKSVWLFSLFLLYVNGGLVVFHVDIVWPRTNGTKEHYWNINILMCTIWPGRGIALLTTWITVKFLIQNRRPNPYTNTHGHLIVHNKSISSTLPTDTEKPYFVYNIIVMKIYTYYNCVYAYTVKPTNDWVIHSYHMKIASGKK